MLAERSTCTGTLDKHENKKINGKLKKRRRDKETGVCRVGDRPGNVERKVVLKTNADNVAKNAAGCQKKLLETVGNVAANVKRQLQEYRSTARPFLTGTNKTFNVNFKINQMMKQRHAGRTPPGGTITKKTFTSIQLSRVRSKIPPKPQEAPEWKKKVKEMFVQLHDEFDELIKIQKNLQKGDGDASKLEEIEKQLIRKELQINVAIALYEQNLALREEVSWLRSHIRPGQRPRRQQALESQHATATSNVYTTATATATTARADRCLFAKQPE